LSDCFLRNDEIVETERDEEEVLVLNAVGDETLEWLDGEHPLAEDDVPSVYELAKNVSFILQSSHFSIGYPRAFMPNVAEIVCIHCKAPQPLPKVLVLKIISI
jgi:hypothetical protein